MDLKKGLTSFFWAWHKGDMDLVIKIDVINKSVMHGGQKVLIQMQQFCTQMQQIE